MNDDPLSLVIKELEVEAYQHGLRSGNRKRGDDDLFRTSHGAPQHAARDKALVLAHAYDMLGRASIALYDCECEFADMEARDKTGYCNEYRDIWDRAVEVVKHRGATP